MEQETKLEQVAQLLSSTGIPTTYQAWPDEESVPDLPYIVYRENNSNPFHADGVVFWFSSSIQILLYTRIRDLRVEGRVEAALSSMTWEKFVDHLDSESCYQILYEIEV